MEFGLADTEFRGLRDLIRKHTGIALHDTKRALVQARLGKRLRQLGIEGFPAYVAFLAGPDGPGEIRQVINAITTNLTRFYREPHHFEHLQHQALPYLLRERAAAKRLRLWSAGCSSGEEPYTLAMTVLAGVPDLAQWDARVLATDIDTEMVRTCKEGVYAAEQAEPLPAEWHRRHLSPTDRPDRLTVADAVRRLVTCKPLNLLDPWPMKGPFDIVFCRNVVIYFDHDTQVELFARIAAMMADDAWLYVGHSESLFRVAPQFKLVGRTIYRKTGTG
ncbi:MAG: protein-glutamate O-methyltransferase [Alphaproteobacteria bacterium]|nr:protein-glutamate O-methyltransferase [Alphaproteobacteria bacterium]